MVGDKKIQAEINKLNRDCSDRTGDLLIKNEKVEARANRLAAVARAAKRSLNSLDAMSKEGLIAEGSYDYLVNALATLHDRDEDI